MKRILALCLVVCFSVMGVSGVASAATKAGDSIVFGSLSYDANTLAVQHVDENIDISTFAANVGLGRFFTDNFEAELGVVGQTTTYDVGHGNNLTETQMGFVVRPNWHFNTASNVVPYVGLTLGYLWDQFFEADEETGGFLYGGQAGIKQFVKENAYIQYELGYTATTFKIYNEDIDFGDFRASIGFGWKF